MRYREFSNPELAAYIVTISLSDHTAAQTMIYASSWDNAWLIASRQYGANSIVAISASNPKPAATTPSPLAYLKNKLRKYTRLAQPTSKPTTFADRAADHLEQGQRRLLAKVKAEKARSQLVAKSKRASKV